MDKFLLGQYKKCCSQINKSEQKKNVLYLGINSRTFIFEHVFLETVVVKTLPTLCLSKCVGWLFKVSLTQAISQVEWAFIIYYHKKFFVEFDWSFLSFDKWSYAMIVYNRIVSSFVIASTKL